MFCIARNHVILLHLFPAIKCLTICPKSCFTESAISWQDSLAMTAHIEQSRCQGFSQWYDLVRQAGKKTFHVDCVIESYNKQYLSDCKHKKLTFKTLDSVNSLGRLITTLHCLYWMEVIQSLLLACKSNGLVVCHFCEFPTEYFPERGLFILISSLMSMNI